MINKELFKTSYEDFDQEIINEIIQMFFDDYQLALTQIQDAILEKDAQKLAQTAHKFKGTVGSMYDIELKEQVQKLEHFGKNNQVDDVDLQLTMDAVIVQSEALVVQLKTMVK